jgi:two-component system nitrate/nitrite response regulator NarL
MRVVIVEDHVLLAESLALALRLERHDATRLPLDTDLATPSEVLTAVIRHRPDVVVLDLDLGARLSGTDLVLPLTAAGVAVLVVTATPDRTEWGGCLRLGARGVLSKFTPLDDVVAAVRRVGEGLPVQSRAEREELVARWQAQRVETVAERERLSRLTPREREVLAELASGLPIHDIADADVVSEATVRTQVKSILGKLEVRTQLAAVGLLHRHDRGRAVS